MKKSIAVSLIALLCSPVALADNPMRPGLYQTNVQMSMPGMPQMPPQSHQFCITQADLAKDPEKATMPSEGMPGECEMYDKNFTGNKSSWKMRCTGANAMQAEGTTTFANDGYTGVIRMTGDFMQTGQPTTMTQNIAAKRLGDCSESSISR